MKFKKCSKCQKVKPISEYAKRENGVFRNECRLCRNAYSRKQYALTKGGRLEARRESREADPKRCIKCGEEKPLSEFGFHNREKGQHRNMCKLCHAEWTRKYNKTPRGKEVREDWQEKNVEKIAAYKELYRNDPVKRKASKAYHRKRRLMQEFGITPKEYDGLLKDQGGKCAICGAIDSDSTGRRLAVDHDHVTGKVRGLLCHNCNVGIGNFKDDPNLLRKAIKYLEADVSKLTN